MSLAPFVALVFVYPYVIWEPSYVADSSPCQPAERLVVSLAFHGLAVAVESPIHKRRCLS
jgi:hypothetical protein